MRVNMHVSFVNSTALKAEICYSHMGTKLVPNEDSKINFCAWKPVFSAVATGFKITSVPKLHTGLHAVFSFCDTALRSSDTVAWSQPATSWSRETEGWTDCKYL